MVDDLDTLPPETETQNEDLHSTITKAVEAQRDAATTEPAGETAEQKADRLRDEAGRFATPDKAVERASPAATVPQAAKPDAVPAAPDPNAPMQIRPPVGWSPTAKAKFDALDPVVQEAIAKRETEVNNGFAKLAEFKSIEPYVEMARSNGANLSDALKIYTEVDRRYAKDPIDGHMAVCENTGIDPRALVAEWARRLGMQLGAPAEGAQPSATPPQPAHDPRLSSIENAVHALLSEREQQSVRSAQSDVKAFWDDPANKYAENVSDIMVSLINQARSQGRSLPLKEAYETACWQHPEVRDLLINERVQTATAGSNPSRQAAVASQARAAAKAVTGAPAGGVPPSGGNAPPPKTVRDAVVAAIAQQAGRI